ncbi:hypothetical protein PUN28_006438 [Cardiocondyla obscurior]|uniref:Uncharacterized protein n=1 Tax=Cardiocondyla obscurior TaxID=286306 RepID=A0AAW2GDM6_9HYME
MLRGSRDLSSCSCVSPRPGSPTNRSILHGTPSWSIHRHSTEQVKVNCLVLYYAAITLCSGCTVHGPSISPRRIGHFRPGLIKIFFGKFRRSRRDSIYQSVSSK